MNAEQATAIVQLLTGTIETRSGRRRARCSPRCPTTIAHYKPDPKSRSAWDLAVHTAMSDIWFADSILSGKFEWTGEPATPAEMTDPAAVAKWHETHMADRLAKLRAMSPERHAAERRVLRHEGPGLHVARADEQPRRPSSRPARRLPARRGIEGAGDLRHERRRERVRLGVRAVTHRARSLIGDCRLAARRCRRAAIDSCSRHS